MTADPTKPPDQQPPGWADMLDRIRDTIDAAARAADDRERRLGTALTLADETNHGGLTSRADGLFEVLAGLDEELAAAAAVADRAARAVASTDEVLGECERAIRGWLENVGGAEGRLLESVRRDV